MVAKPISGQSGAHWTEEYSVLVLRDPLEPEDCQFLAVLLERNVVGQGGSIAEALQDAQDQLVCDYEVQLAENLPRPQADPDPALMSTFQNPAQRVTSEGEEVLLRLSATLTVSFGRTTGAKERSKPNSPLPTFEFESQAVG
jgi:hypothetical protein